MKYGVIDIGSNSVRLMISGGGEHYKISRITRLAKGMNTNGMIQQQPESDTLSVLTEFKRHCENVGADKIYCFATSAVRTAVNGAEFTDKIKTLLGFTVDVLSEAQEAQAGFTGALCGKDGGVIDIGGGSTEIQVGAGGRQVYAKSLPFGAVRVTDICGQDERAADEYIRQMVLKYGNLPHAEYYAIGGTAINSAAMLMSLKEYDPNKTHNYLIDIERLRALKKRLYATPVQERGLITGIQSGREAVIAAGTAILIAIMDSVEIKSVTVSESDNLEGYLMRKLKCQEEQTL